MRHGEIIPIAYSVKYALTKGIIERKDACVYISCRGSVANGYEAQEGEAVYLTESEHHGGHYFEVLGKDIFLTLEEAKRAAKKMKLRKLEFLARQIAKLGRLEF